MKSLLEFLRKKKNWLLSFMRTPLLPFEEPESFVSSKALLIFASIFTFSILSESLNARIVEPLWVYALCVLYLSWTCWSSYFKMKSNIKMFFDRHMHLGFLAIAFFIMSNGNPFPYMVLLTSIVFVFPYFMRKHYHLLEFYVFTTIPLWLEPFALGLTVLLFSMGFISLLSVKLLANLITRIRCTDSLTGVLNRDTLHISARPNILSTTERGNLLGILFIDLDKFKQVNDKHGHLHGDLLLRAVVSRMTGEIKSTDYLIRTGGDEFVIILADIDPSKADQIIEKKCKTILRSIKQEYSIQGTKVKITASIGATSCPYGEEEDIDIAIERADELMYEAKKKGKNNFMYNANGELPD